MRFKPTCFIIMPFSKAFSAVGKYETLGRDELDTIYDLLCRIFDGLGYKTRRAESAGDILAEIVLALDEADLVCADLTGLNPNVMYELGIRHGFTKKTIILSQDVAELPFDLRNYHCIEYRWITKRDQQELEAKIREVLVLADGNPNTSYSPVQTHLGTKVLGYREQTKRSVLKKLAALMAELGFIRETIKASLVDHCQNISGDVVTRDGNTLTFNSHKIPKEEFDKPLKFSEQIKQVLTQSYPSIDHILVERYIPDEFDQFGEVENFYGSLGLFRYHLKIHDVTIRPCLAILTTLDLLLEAAKIVQRAVKNDLYGQKLGIEIKER